MKRKERERDSQCYAKLCSVLNVTVQVKNGENYIKGDIQQWDFTTQSKKANCHRSYCKLGHGSFYFPVFEIETVFSSLSF